MAVRCPFDKQGRINIPQKLQEWAHLERELVFTGVGNRIELWDRSRHMAELERAREGYGAFSTDLKDFGL